MKINPLARTALLLISSAVFILSLSACASGKQAPLATVSSVDLARYQGKWYEVALLPNRFQAMCVADTQAEYRPKGEAIEVINRCRKIDGSIEIAEGIAKVVPASGNSKLRVSFFRPFYGNYWILDLDPNYQWVLVGEPGRKYGWVLSRTAVLPAATFNTILDKAASLGYQRSDFQLSPQTTPLD
ncbi:lipocalin family protein [Undibacterium sp.]|uniref:lipocalin family protein n=1 Tax=Undibacterium sp. TaxID=1914977 RepID=UPI0025DC6D6B|nr:lipocalin family protein [Undibacterium sp.]